MAIEYDYYAIAQKLKDAGADDTIKNNDGIEARTGIEGNKCIEFARFLQAEDGEEILAALEGLKTVVMGKDKKLVDKGELVGAGMRMKKENKKEWTSVESVNVTFIEVVRAL